MSQIKEAIANLGIISAIADNDEPAQDEGECEACFPKIKRLADKTIALLRAEQPPHPCNYVNFDRVAQEQPPEGDFTKDIRDKYGSTFIIAKQFSNEKHWELELDFSETCDRLDTETKRVEKLDELYTKCNTERLQETQRADKAEAERRLWQVRALEAKDNLEINDRANAKLEAKLKEKDELLFAYESVNAPVNPLLSINKELLGLCEEFMEKADDGSADFDDPKPGSIYLRAKAAIKKANEG